MGDEALRKQARERAVANGLPYAGALTPQEAHEMMRENDKARLVDVRTKAELNYVGRIPGAIEIEWLDWPNMQVNDNFVAALRDTGMDSADPVMFICRSGVRSHNASLAAQAAGFEDVYNVIEGFEGDPDENGQRNKVNGWRYHNLPWHQS